jgi:hypothetical protein
LHVNGRTSVVATLHERNLPAQLFLRACGFAATRVLRGLYGVDCGIRFEFSVIPEELDCGGI